MKESIHVQLFEDLKAELRSWNIKSVSVASGVSDACIWYWVQGKTKKPRLDTIMKVADAIGFDVKLIKRTRMRLVA